MMNISLITNPADDDAFRLLAEHFVAEGADSAGRLQGWLKKAYPSALVVQGIRDTHGDRWYAYREGHWVRQEEID